MLARQLGLVCRNGVLSLVMAGGLACRTTGEARAPSASADRAASVQAPTPAVQVMPAGSTGEAPGPYRFPSDPRTLSPKDVFGLEWAADPRIAPDGDRLVYARGSMDVWTDRRRSQIWIAAADGSGHRPLTSPDDGDFHSPRWSPEGDRILFVGNHGGKTQLYVHWVESGRSSRITNLTESPSDVEWSRDGSSVAFTMRVPADPEPLVTLPKPPEGAEWAGSPEAIDKLTYRKDGSGYVEAGYDHLFVVPAEGGTPRQLTDGEFHHSDPVWTADGRSIVVVANRQPDWEYDPSESDLYAVSVAGGEVRRLTDRDGPDEEPAISHDGQQIAYIGFDDQRKGHHVRQLHVMNLDGSGRRVLAEDLDRSVKGPVWAADDRGIYVQYDDRGNGKIAYLPLEGERKVVARDLGGLSLGRPYGGGSFTAARDGTIAFNTTRPDHPADVAVVARGRKRPVRITRLNQDLLGHKQLASVEAFWVESSHDQRKIQGWVAKPPGFDEEQDYPLVLEIHGGPFANYGDRFAAEIQLYAAAGYVVVYVNPRGSTSYGDEFANLIHHAYPGHDYDDLMSAVDEIVSRGYIDADRLYVTGGSGGGVLTSWIVGKTDRFRAAVVAKPVINWSSFVLTADMSPFFTEYWFPGMPWEDPEHYRERSPISLVGNVNTPTMLLTGEADYRTPISETEQFYQALKLRKIDTMLVRIPGASHSIGARPSHLTAKVLYILGWFHRFSEASSSD